jgi:hypothetical protein
MSEKKRIVVTVDEHEKNVAKVAKALKAKGFNVEEVLEFTGNVIGEFEGDPDELMKVRGVAAAVQERSDYKPQ